MNRIASKIMDPELARYVTGFDANELRELATLMDAFSRYMITVAHGGNAAEPSVPPKFKPVIAAALGVSRN